MKCPGSINAFHFIADAHALITIAIEVISPAGFENYFREVAAAWGDLEQFAQINAKYSLDMDFNSVPGLCERFGLKFPEL